MVKRRLEFLTDKHISPVIAQVLTSMGMHTRSLLKEHPERIEDADWIPWASEQGLHIITNDHRILRREAEAAALASAEVVAFFVATGVFQLAPDDQVIWFIRHRHVFTDAALASPPGSIFNIKMQGKIEPIQIRR